MANFRVPENQTVSFTVYCQAIQTTGGLPYEFLKAHAAQIERAFDHGETIAQIVEELKMRFSIRPIHRPTKTPRQLARRVVVVSR